MLRSDGFPADLFTKALFATLLASVLLLGIVPVGNALAQSSQGEALQALHSDSPQERRLALRWLEEQGDATAVDPLVAVLQQNLPPESNLAAQALWGVWSRSGDEETDRLLRRGTTQLASGLVQQSIVTFNEVIQRSPDFAEGYNKRATALYNLGDYRASLEDIDRVLERNPVHFGALSGAGLCNIGLKQWAAAVAWFNRALQVNPTMDGIEDLRAEIITKYQKPI